MEKFLEIFIEEWSCEIERGVFYQLRYQHKAFQKSIHPRNSPIEIEFIDFFDASNPLTAELPLK